MESLGDRTAKIHVGEYPHAPTDGQSDSRPGDKHGELGESQLKEVNEINKGTQFW